MRKCKQCGKIYASDEDLKDKIWYKTLKKDLKLYFKEYMEDKNVRR